MPGHSFATLEEILSYSSLCPLHARIMIFNVSLIENTMTYLPL